MPELTPFAQRVIEQMPPNKPARRAKDIIEDLDADGGQVMAILKELRKSGIVESTRGGWWRRV